MARRRPDDDDYEVRPKRRKTGKKSRGSSHQRWIIAGTAIAGITILSVVAWAFLVTPYLQMRREAAWRAVDKNNLKQITLAVHNYYDQYNSFPPAGIQNADGQYTTSWMASILPFLRTNAPVPTIDFNRPINDPANQTAYAMRIPGFLNPGHPDPGNEPLAHYAGNTFVFPAQNGIRFRDITDGTSNTLLLGDVSAGFKRWSDPTNVRDPGRGIGATPDQFSSPFPGGCHFALCDGSVRFIKDTIDPEFLRILATPNGGERPNDF